MTNSAVARNNQNCLKSDSGNLSDIRFCVFQGNEIDDALLARMIRLLQMSFEGWPLFELQVPAAQCLRWQIEGPAGKPSMIVLGKEKSELVSMNVMLRRSFLLYGQLVDVIDGINSCVHPEHRGRGIFSARRSYQESHLGDLFCLEIGYSRHPAIRHDWNARNHFPLANGVQVLARPLNPLALLGEGAGTSSLRRMVGPITASSTWVLSRIASWRYRASESKCQSFNISVIERFDERADKLFKRVSSRFDFIQVRNHRYLNWRYCDDRSGEFSVLGIEEGDELLGYIAIKISRRRGYIADILCLPERFDIVRCLTEAALRRMRDHAVVAICWLPRRHPYAQLLRGLGFVDIRRPIGLNVKPLGISELEQRVFKEPEGSLHLMQGDSDTI